MKGFIDRFQNHRLCIAHRDVFKILTFLLIATVAVAATASPTLSRVSCGKSSFSGTATDACSVYLTGKTKGKYYVALSSNDPAVVVPSGVTVKAGAASTGFNATVAAVTTSQVATITAQAGGTTSSFAISLSPGSGSGTASLGVNATSIAFGSVVVNTPAAQALTLSSTGTAPLTVNSVSLSGTGFSVSGATFPATLNPGQSLTLEVQFDPTTVGPYTGQLTISSSAATDCFPLSGTGATHQVDLSWAAPSASQDPVVGYNVYRATSGSSSYQRINAALEPLLVYSDTSVQSGAAYDYIVKSVDAQGVESVPSNVTTVAVP